MEKQLALIESDRTWGRLDRRTREVGLLGVARARRVLRAAAGCVPAEDEGRPAGISDLSADRGVEPGSDLTAQPTLGSPRAAA